MNKLALLGGNPAITTQNLSIFQQPKVSESAMCDVVEMMKKGDISRSEKISEFEQKFASYIGVKHALAVSNGTSSLISAIYAVGIGPGDEVIVPSFSFWATSACVLSSYGIPVFADIAPETYNLSPQDIEDKITDRTKAIVVVHVYGNPADMDAIMALAKKYKLKVIEDCSHAHGALYNGRKVGSIGDVGCFSMQAEKLVCAGEGGILTTNDTELYSRAVILAHYEKAQLLPDSRFNRYALTGMGLKFRPHPLAIAMASYSLDQLDEVSIVRNRNAMTIQNELAKHSAFSCQKVDEKALRQFSYHYIQYHPEHFHNIPMTLLVKALRAEGVPVVLCGFGKVHLTPLFTEPYTYANGILPIENSTYNPNTKLHVSEKLADALFICAPRIEIDNTGVEQQYINAYEKVINLAESLKKYENENPAFQNWNAEQMDIIKAITKFRKSKNEKQ